MKELTIQTEQKGKGRAFSASLVSYVEAAVLPRGNDTIRPVYLALAGTENELRPFVANLRTGKKAEAGYRGRERFEVLKSSGFQCSWQRTPLGALVTLFAPDYFALDPGMVDPKGVEFIVLPAQRWLRESSVEVPSFVPEDRAADVRHLAPLFIAYLDRRTRCPLIPDPRFYVQVLSHALDQGLACFSQTSGSRYSRAWGESSTYEEYETSAVGLAGRARSGQSSWNCSAYGSMSDRVERSERMRSTCDVPWYRGNMMLVGFFWPMRSTRPTACR
jgi:hypothetical protein